jgi:pimeloyl-ACP methyl ester carboxylesterase
MFKPRALLIIAGLSAAFGFDFGAAAETSVVAPAGSQASPGGESRLVQEGSRREHELSKQGFNFVHYVPPDEPLPVELFLLRSNVDYPISLWFQTEQGSFAVDLRDPTGQSVASFQAWRGELHVEHRFAAGKYVVSVRATDGARVHGIIGVKGPVVGRCPVDQARLIEQPADPPRYSWPYLLVKPVGLAADAPASARDGTLLVVPNNTGSPSENEDALRASAICELGFGESAGPLAIADGLGAPLLMPLFPRPEQLYLQALTRESLSKDVEPKFNRVDKQLIAMIDDARAKLAAMNHPVQPRVLMAGFSASGVFTNRFAVLHPERVLAAAVGGPGGWPIAPVRADQGKMLPYPVGIADLDTEELGGQSVDLAALQRVRFLFLLGAADTNDAVPCTDSFSDSEASLINSLYGTVGIKCGEGAETVVKRWWPAQRLYHAAGLNARFKLYPDVRHEMGMTPVMWNDVLDMFRKALSAR